jgi:hypothetical protein
VINRSKAILSVLLYPIVKLSGESMSHEFLDTTVIRSGVRKALDTCTMVAYEKTAEDDNRDTNWFRHL